MAILFFRKKAAESIEGQHLQKCLNGLDVTMMGIGAIVGAGIFVLTGVAAATSAGPSIVISFIVSGLACLFVALSYAEMAASIGGCGSAYGYAYVGLGELVAWAIGWDLLLEYGLGISTVAVGWSGYVANAFSAIGMDLPVSILKGPLEGGIINLPAFFVIFGLSLLLSLGVKESVKFNSLIVLVKLLAILVFILVSIFHVDLSHWSVFMPFGWNGVMHAAALVFFAYIGFDAVSTAAEETINPQKNLPIGIIGSLIACTLIYIAVSALLTLVAPYQNLNVSSPVAHVLLNLNHPIAAGLISAGAIAGLTTVMLVLYYGFSRIVLAMSRDGLLPSNMAKINKKTKTPVNIIISSGIVFSLIAGLTPIGHLAELVNIGTLAAFVVVCAGTIVLRIKNPTMLRPFKLPLGFLVPALGIGFCLYLMLSLPIVTWIRFFAWMGIGLVIYFLYGIKQSRLAKNADNYSDIPDVDF